MSDNDKIIELCSIITKLRGQLQNCVNHLEHAKRQYPSRSCKYDKCIESANKALYETLEY